MEKCKNKKAFTLLELIIVVAIIAVLSVAAYIGVRHTQDLMKNNRVTNDLIAIESALNQYFHDNDEQFPVPSLGGDMNILCFDASAAYVDCAEGEFMQGVIDNELLSKRYLPEVPLDPWSGARYAYGVTADRKYFMVAGLYHNGDDFVAYTISNVYKGFHLPSLIRAYDGPDFVTHNGHYLPYSPERYSVTGQLVNITGSVTITDADTNPKDAGLPLVPGDTVITNSGTADIFFSDGSVTRLMEGTRLEILETSSAEEGKDDNIITKIRLKLFEGKIWNKVVRLAEKSEFNIETTAAIAGVRGTEFGFTSDNKLIVYSGSVYRRLKTGEEETFADPEFDPAFSSADLAELITEDEPLVFGMSGSGNPPDTDEQMFIDKGLSDSLHSGLYPYILAFDIPQMGGGLPGEFFVVNIGVNSLNSEDYGIDGFEVFPKNLFSTKGERIVNDDVLNEDGTPASPEVEDIYNHVTLPSALSVNTFTYDENEEIYKLALPMPPESGGRYISDSVAVRMYSNTGGSRVYSGFSWPPGSFNVADDDLETEGIFADFTEGSLYDNLKSSGVCTITLISPYDLSKNIYPNSEFRWRPSADCGEVKEYVSAVTSEGGTIPPTLPPIPDPDAKYASFSLDPYTDYTLKIEALDGDGTVLARKTFKFTTGDALAVNNIEVMGDEGIDVSDAGPYDYTAFAYFNNGDSAEVACDDGWSLSPASAGSINKYGAFSPAPAGVYVHAGESKTVNITCTYEGIPGSLPVTLTAPSEFKLESIDILEPDPALIAGRPHKFKVTGNYPDGPADIASRCVWTITPDDKGTMDGYGVFTPNADSDGTNISFICTDTDSSVSSPEKTFAVLCNNDDTRSEDCSAEIDNGTGSKLFTCVANAWEADICKVTDCDTGYVQDGNSCIVYRYCGDGTTDTDLSEDCDDANAIAYDACDECKLTYNTFYADYTDSSTDADFSLGSGSGSPTGSYTVSAEGLNITAADGNYVEYSGENNLSPYSKIVLVVKKDELKAAPYSYIFDAVDDSGNHVEVYKSSLGELWLKIGGTSGSYFSNLSFLDSLSEEYIKIVFSWDSAETQLELQAEDGTVISPAPTSGGTPPVLSFTAASKFYVGSRELGKINDTVPPYGDVLQYTGYIKEVEIKQMP